MKKALFIFISVLALSCSGDGNDTNKTALNLVTGVTFRQNPDDAPLQLGNPNVLINGKFTIYPNPAIETFIITSQETITDVWVVPATAQKIYQDEDFSSILNTNLYSEQSISSTADFSLNGQSANSINVNIGTLDQGYYRVFVKIGGAIYWDNLYKYGSQGSSEGQISAIVNFWN